MKNLKLILGSLILLTSVAGCSPIHYQANSNTFDDLYGIHNRTAIAQRQQAQAEAKKAEADARQAQWEAKLAELQAEASEDAYNDAAYGVVADDYESAYARRLKGFRSPTYQMPASYFELRYNNSTDLNFAMSYNPDFYNVMVSGDEVWVEPKYITSMFGTWGAAPYGGWYVGWNSPSYYSSWWGYPRYSWWDWNWSLGYNPWYDPWYGPCWGYPCYGYYPGYLPSYRPQETNIVHRPRPYRSPNSDLSGGSSVPTFNRGNGSGGGYNSGVYQGGSRFNGNTSFGTTSRPNDRNNSYNSGFGGSNSNRTGGRRSATSGSPYSGSTYQSPPAYQGPPQGGGFTGGSGGGFSPGRGGSSTGSSSRGR